MKLWKAHHGIMKSDALADYNKIKAYCEERGIKIVNGAFSRQLTIFRIDARIKIMFFALKIGILSI